MNNDITKEEIKFLLSGFNETLELIEGFQASHRKRWDDDYKGDSSAEDKATYDGFYEEDVVLAEQYAVYRKIVQKLEIAFYIISSIEKIKEYHPEEYKDVTSVYGIDFTELTNHFSKVCEDISKDILDHIPPT